MKGRKFRLYLSNLRFIYCMDAQDIFLNRNNIVPVIGENCFFYVNGDCRKPLQDFIVEKMIEKKNLPVSCLPIATMKERGYYGLSLCRQQMGFARDEEFLKCYKAIIKEHHSSIHLDETIKNFLMAYNFHLIVTTCCFDFIETEMPWYKSKVYVAANGANNKEEINPNEYVVYHLLGMANGAYRWAWDEESLLYIIHCHHNSDYASNGLYRYLFPDPNSGQTNKSLLVMHSNLPDWLFRFFLYPLAYKEQWSSGIYLNSTSVANDSLKNFIERVICFDVAESEVDDILYEATHLIPAVGDDQICRDSHGMEYDIFMSYANEDAVIAEEIKSILESRFTLRVWLDRKGGIEDGSYPERMKYGIENSAYFMPLITTSYMSKLRNNVCGESMTIEEVLQDDGKMPYNQKEALAADLRWKELKQICPQRKAYVLPVLFPDSNITFETIRQCVLNLRQLPKMFDMQTMFTYNTTLFVEKDWKRYKTIEKF